MSMSRKQTNHCWIKVRWTQLRFLLIVYTSTHRDESGQQVLNRLVCRQSSMSFNLAGKQTDHDAFEPYTAILWAWRGERKIQASQHGLITSWSSGSQQTERKLTSDPESDNGSFEPLQFELDFILAMWFRYWQLTKGDITKVVDVKRTNLFNNIGRPFTNEKLEDLDLLQQAIKNMFEYYYNSAMEHLSSERNDTPKSMCDSPPPPRTPFIFPMLTANNEERETELLLYQAKDSFRIQTEGKEWFRIMQPRKPYLNYGIRGFRCFLEMPLCVWFRSLS